jgi:hypothetical protein
MLSKLSWDVIIIARWDAVEISAPAEITDSRLEYHLLELACSNECRGKGSTLGGEHAGEVASEDDSFLTAVHLRNHRGPQETKTKIQS